MRSSWDLRGGGDGIGIGDVGGEGEMETCGLAGPQPKQWLARSSMGGVSIEAGVWRAVSELGMASGLHVSTVRGGMNSDSVCGEARFEHPLEDTRSFKQNAGVLPLRRLRVRI